jgi:prepilin-type N-terminal cleavage/methylation domain-containing protein
MQQNSTECTLARRRRGQAAFTLMEIMIVVLIISLLSSIALPMFRKARLRTNLTRVANDLKVFGSAFDLYSMERRGYPPDCDQTASNHLPNAAMAEYLKVNKWTETTAIGGNFEWEGRNVYPYAGIAIVGSDASDDVMRGLDAIIDDGNLATGHFRKIPANSRCTYIIDE